MNCDDFKKIVGDFLDDEVARDLYDEVKSHLSACGACSVEVDSLKKTILIYRNAAQPAELPADVRQRLFAVLSFEYRNTRRHPSS